MAGMGGKRTLADGHFLREKNQRCSVMPGVSAKRLTANGDPSPDCRIEDIEEGWGSGTNMHAVELRRTVNKVTVIRAQAARKLQNKRLFLRVTLGDALIVRRASKNLDC